jgi:osmotically-inducible protein OsmY
MRTDAQIHKDVIDQLEATLGAGASGIGVSVSDGTVTLSGTAASYTDKYAAERAAFEVPGVRCVCEAVGVGHDHERGDDEIAQAVERALLQDESVPAAVHATVEGGWVTLRGEVASESQKDAAVNAVRRRAGVERIYNLITAKPVGYGAMTRPLGQRVHEDANADQPGGGKIGDSYR